MCTALLPLGVNTIALNKYIKYLLFLLLISIIIIVSSSLLLFFSLVLLKNLISAAVSLQVSTK